MEVTAIGGYDEVGRNMTAVRVGEEVVVFDMGLALEPYIAYVEDEDIVHVKAEDLTRVGAVPDLKHLKGEVLAIVPTHAHLDHIGAIPYLMHKFSCPVICSPYTAAVLKRIEEAGDVKVKPLTPGNSIKLSESLTLEFVRITHSVPQSVLAVLHTPEGAFVYANDYKFDLFPVIEKKPNLSRLTKLGKEGVKALVVDSLYAHKSMKTPSERIAREMLREVMLALDSNGHAMIVTTFSSHLARLKSVVDFAREMGRKPVFIGRSLGRYVEAGIEAGIWPEDEVELVTYPDHIKRKLRQIQKEGVDKYLIVVTGHQGEPKAVLARMVSGLLPFEFRKEDIVIFSCQVIPTPTNKANREALEEQLHSKGVRVLTDIHVSGHAAREDHRELINMLKPEHIIPAHGGELFRGAMVEFSKELGYVPGRTVHLLSNGQRRNI